MGVISPDHRDGFTQEGAAPQGPVPRWPWTPGSRALTWGYSCCAPLGHKNRSPTTDHRLPDYRSPPSRKGVFTFA